jgi:hypothetical protein
MLKTNPAMWVPDQIRLGHNKGTYMLEIMHRSIIYHLIPLIITKLS